MSMTEITGKNYCEARVQDHAACDAKDRKNP